MANNLIRVSDTKEVWVDPDQIHVVWQVEISEPYTCLMSYGKEILTELPIQEVLRRLGRLSLIDAVSNSKKF